MQCVDWRDVRLLRLSPHMPNDRRLPMMTSRSPNAANRR